MCLIKTICKTGIFRHERTFFSAKWRVPFGALWRSFAATLLSFKSDDSIYRKNWKITINTGIKPVHSANGAFETVRFFRIQKPERIASDFTDALGAMMIGS